MFRGKPIIGIVGGIGSGKTFIADLFGKLGCMVIHADALVRAAYDDPAVREILRAWWGAEVFRADGAIDRAAIARKVFQQPRERLRLEGLLHPRVDAERKRMMVEAGPETVAFVWDTPLLVEAGLNAQCDALVYIDAPETERVARVMSQRQWDAGELSRREKLQMPLDKKREISDYVLVNTAEAAADADFARCQVQKILSRIVAGLPARP